MRPDRPRYPPSLSEGHVASIEILQLTDAELDTIAGGGALDGLDLLSRAMGGSVVINNLIRKFDIYYLRT
jgi:hypothetical protein